MNPVYSAASSGSELGWLLGLTTAAFLVAFVGWVLWAFSPRNTAAFRAMAHLPLEEEGRNP
jgi:cbb3-type cytochrome oxidase subunit 3